MKASEIKVGRTYRNRGAGRTHRTVLEISDTIGCHWYGDPRNKPPDGTMVVRYSQVIGKTTMQDTSYLSSFAAWAGGQVK